MALTQICQLQLHHTLQAAPKRLDKVKYVNSRQICEEPMLTMASSNGLQARLKPGALAMLGYQLGCWYGQQFRFMCKKLCLASCWILPQASRLPLDSAHTLAHSHTRTISREQKQKHCAILCLFAGKIEAYYAAAHAATRFVQKLYFSYFDSTCPGYLLATPTHAALSS